MKALILILVAVDIVIGIYNASKIHEILKNKPPEDKDLQKLSDTLTETKQDIEGTIP